MARSTKRADLRPSGWTAPERDPAVLAATPLRPSIAEWLAARGSTHALTPGRAEQTEAAS